MDVSNNNFGPDLNGVLPPPPLPDFSKKANPKVKEVASKALPSHTDALNAAFAKGSGFGLKPVSNQDDNNAAPAPQNPLMQQILAKQQEMQEKKAGLTDEERSAKLDKIIVQNMGPAKIEQEKKPKNPLMEEIVTKGKKKQEQKVGLTDEERVAKLDKTIKQNMAQKNDRPILQPSAIIKNPVQKKPPVKLTGRPAEVTEAALKTRAEFEAKQKAVQGNFAQDTLKIAEQKAAQDAKNALNSAKVEQAKQNAQNSKPASVAVVATVVNETVPIFSKVAPKAQPAASVTTKPVARKAIKTVYGANTQVHKAQIVDPKLVKATLVVPSKAITVAPKEVNAPQQAATVAPKQPSQADAPVVPKDSLLADAPVVPKDSLLVTKSRLAASKLAQPAAQLVVQQAPVVTQSKVVIAQPAPVVTQSKVVATQLAPVITQSKLVVAQPVPVVAQPTTVVPNTAPAFIATFRNGNAQQKEFLKQQIRTNRPLLIQVISMDATMQASLLNR